MTGYPGTYDYLSSGNPEKLQHFLPHDVVLLIDHPDALNRIDLDRLLRRLNENSGATKLREPNYVFSCPPCAQRGPFSLVFTRVEDRDPDPATLVPHLTRVNQLADTRRQRDQPLLRLASPNWLAGGAPPIPWGGPGAPPVPVSTDHAARPRYRFRLPRGLGWRRPRRQRGAGVDVAILDTAPRPNALAQAYARWRETQPLIRSLLRPRGRLTVSYDESGYVPPESYTLVEHPYHMPDHGLFAAGVVHSIAPQTSLHVIETLNEWGVGDLERLMYVLYQFVGRRDTRPLVINCSLVLNIPQPDLLSQLTAENRRWSGLDGALIEQMNLPLRWVCDVLQSQGVMLVAAAGNDTRSETPAQARYPAAFDSVVGVGALGHDGQPAGYSNRADRPSEAGVATFGGSANNEQIAAEHGMLGIYTNTFPDGSPNTNGWAWWAGTSFATPVISGTLAAMLSENPDPDAALTRIKDVAADRGLTPIGPAFPVHQA